jgi:HEAT repeat protein
VRRSALEAIAAQVARTPPAASALGRAMLGPVRAEAESLLGRLLDATGPSADAAEEAVTEVALDAKAPEEARLSALRLLRHRPATPAALQKIAGSPRLMAAAMPLVARANPEAATAQVAEAMHGAAPMRAAAAATLGLLPRTADTPKLLKVLQNDSAVEVHAEAVRALPVLGHEALPLLMKEAKGGGEPVEKAAVEAMGAQANKLGAAAAVAALETVAKTARASTRLAAIAALGRIAESKPALVAAALGRLLHDKVPDVRAVAAGALGDVLAHRAEAGHEATAALRSATRDPDPAARRRAAEALGRARGALGAGAAKALAAFVGDADASVRVSAAAALGELGAAAKGSPAFAALVGDKDPTVRVAGRKAAQQVGPGAGDIDRVLVASFAAAPVAERVDIATTAAVVGAPLSLRAAFGDPEAGVRRAAAEHAAALDEAQAPVLVAALADADPAVKLAAVRGLIGGRAARPLAQAARGPDLDVRVAALEALGQVGGSEAREALEAAAADGSERVRVAAMRGLAGLGPAAAELLERALGDASCDVREAAVTGLGAAWADRPLPELRARLGDDAHADLRFAAALALARRADPPTGKGADAVRLLDDVIAHGTPLSRLAALIARAFIGRAEAMPSFLHVLRQG